MERIENLKTYTQEELRKNVVKALFGENAALGINYVNFLYEDDNGAGILVNFRDKNHPCFTKTFIIRIDDVTD